MKLGILWTTLLVVPLALRGVEIELTPETACEGRLTSNASETYRLAGKAQEYISVAVYLKQSTGRAQILDDKDAILQERQIDERGQIGFVAPTEGKFRVKLLAAMPCNYTIELNKPISVEQRLNPSPYPIRSPRIKTLYSALEAREPQALTKFWEELKVKGTPLIEPLVGDDKRMLVTFVWSGRPATRRVSLLWESLSRIAPDKVALTCMDGTNVWFSTIDVTRTKRFYYKYVENGPMPPRVDDPDARTISSIRQGMAEIDPLNPKQFDDTPNPGSDFYGPASLVEMPDAPREPWIRHRDGVPAGRLSSQVFKSLVLNNERTISVYTPPGYQASGSPFGAIFLTDGDSYIRGQFALNVLDNLIAEHQIPPIVAVLINNAPGGRTKELSCDPKFEECLISEIVPWAQRSFNITQDPKRTIIAGLSLGGLTAAYMAYRHSEIFGNVLAQSGSFWWIPPRNRARPGERDYDAEPNWLAAEFLKSPKLPLRFYLSTGLDELDMRGKGASILVPNRRLRDVLRAKGYEVSYEEMDGAHDSLNWRTTFPRGLIALAKGF